MWLILNTIDTVGYSIFSRRFARIFSAEGAEIEINTELFFVRLCASLFAFVVSKSLVEVRFTIVD